MSNSGSITPPVSGATKPSAPSGQVVQIQTLPEALKTVSRAIRIEGEVVQQNRDGSVRISTPQGDVDVTVRGRQPQQGQRLEVDIPAGSPPRTATIRNAPPAPPPAQQQPSQPQPAPAQTPPPPAPNIPLPQTPVAKPLPQPTAPPSTNPPAGQSPVPAPAPAPSSPRPAPSLPPVQTGGTPQPSVPATTGSIPLPQPSPGMSAQSLPAVTPSSESQAAGKPQLPLPASYQPTAQGLLKQGTVNFPALTTGQTVRLTPAPPAQTILPSLTQLSGAPEQIITSQLGRINFQTNLIAQAVKSSLPATLIQTMKPAGIAAQVLLSQASTPIPATPDKAAGTIPNSLLPNVKSIANLLQPLPGSIGKTAPAPMETLSGARPITIDAKIIEVKPLQVQIVSIDGKQNAGLVKSTGGENSPMTRPANIVATVTGFTPQNLPVISMRLPASPLPQNFVLQFTAGNLSTGSQIVLSPAPMGAGTVAGTSLPALRPVQPLLQPSMLWPAIDDIFQSFQSTTQAAQSLGRLVPSPSNAGNFGPAAVLFIAAAKAGELQNWMGEKRLEALQKLGKGSLMSRLSGETAPLSRSGGDSASAEWRTYPIPLLWQNEISKVTLHMKHEPPEQGKDNQEGSARFIFDLDLTRMGGVQLDGLLRGKRLDLIIRTQLPISTSMQQAMKIAYANALDGTDIYGEISFQGDLKSWMVIGNNKNLKMDV